jgi:NAD(P)-dependent dehydrogenase (short-subunit alcohol dehydrogenase family)
MSPRHVVVTGGTGGIGLAVARSAVARGDRVVIVGRDRTRAETSAKDMVDLAGEVTPVLGDVGSPSTAADACAEAARVLDGYVDVLVNAAGVILVDPIRDLDDVDWTQVIGTNLNGCLNMTKGLWAALVGHRGSRIVNVSSVAGVIGSPGRGAYAASKGGVHALTRVIASEIGPHGGTANAVAPGPISGGMATHKAGYVPPNETRFASEIPARRFGEVAEVVACVDFLSSAAASYVNGHVLVVDGGWTATRHVDAVE